MYNISFIPSIIVVTKNGVIVSKRGTQEIEQNGVNVLVMWAP